MYNGYNKIFWGIIIATFNIKLGMIKILPQFIGFIVISSGISFLHRKTNIELFNKANIFAIITIIAVFILELAEFLSIESMNFFVFSEVWTVFYAVMEMIMFYKCFEGSIEYFNANNYLDLAKKSIKNIRFYIVASIISIILLNIALVFNITFLYIIVAIVFVVLRIYLMVIIYGFRNIFAE